MGRVRIHFPNGYTDDEILGGSTKGILGLPQSATPDDAFRRLMNLITTKIPVPITVQDSTGRRVPGMPLTGVVDVKGEPIATDSDGYALGFADSGVVTISAVSPFADLQSASKQVTLSAGALVEVVITVAGYPNNYRVFTESCEIMFSPFVRDIDVCCVGGGGGGGGATACSDYYSNPLQNGGGGGAGGAVVNKLGITVSPTTKYPIIVGGKGAAGENTPGDSSSSWTGKVGGQGGATSAFGVAAAGGTGGNPSRYRSNSVTRGAAASGNGSGGAGSEPYTQAEAGGAGTVYEFGEVSRQKFGGGGGGGSGDIATSAAVAGGAPHGGAGAISVGGSYGRDAFAGAGPGGGGGGGAVLRDWNGGKPGAGGPGQVSIRWRYK